VQLQAVIGRALEEGRLQSSMARAVAAVWGPVAARYLERRLPIPAGIRVVAVGGATLGGSGKTPLAVACARELAASGARVALVGHAYRACPGAPRRVSPEHSMVEVGDEALVAARALGPDVAVVVASSRALAVAEAAQSADVLVLDGVIQTTPRRAALALLAVDECEPWGRARAVPPLGDLRAPRDALCEAVDAVVVIGETAPDARVRSRGAWMEGRLVPWDELRSLRLGFACALARPERVLRALAARGVVPAAVVRGPDHGPLPRRKLAELSSSVDLWLATAKCAVHLGSSRIPVATIDHELELSAALRARLAKLARLDPGGDQQ
jgi:tetraacyldisaccharide 4'-kinase